jgi:hypothetical protein
MSPKGSSVPSILPVGAILRTGRKSRTLAEELP